MKLLRVCLLLLLVALLPLRGSFARALMLDGDAAICHAESGERMHPPASRHAAQHAHALASAIENRHGTAGTPDKCNLCSGVTTAAGPIESLSGFTPAVAAVKTRARPTVWPASFISAGLERPPRSA